VSDICLLCSQLVSQHMQLASRRVRPQARLHQSGLKLSFQQSRGAWMTLFRCSPFN